MSSISCRESEPVFSGADSSKKTQQLYLLEGQEICVTGKRNYESGDGERVENEKLELKEWKLELEIWLLEKKASYTLKNISSGLYSVFTDF